MLKKKEREYVGSIQEYRDRISTYVKRFSKDRNLRLQERPLERELLGDILPNADMTPENQEKFRESVNLRKSSGHRKTLAQIAAALKNCGDSFRRTKKDLKDALSPGGEYYLVLTASNNEIAGTRKMIDDMEKKTREMTLEFEIGKGKILSRLRQIKAMIGSGVPKLK